MPGANKKGNPVCASQSGAFGQLLPAQDGRCAHET